MSMDKQVTLEAQTGSPPPPTVVEHVHWEHPHPTPPSDRVPARRKIAYGMGTLTDFFYANVLQIMYTPIFVIAMKMDPFIIGLAMSFTRMIGAVTDPFVGTLSDNTRSRWGRRRPYIAGSVVLGAILLPLIWMVPRNSSLVQYSYVVIMLALFAVIYSFFSVPYGALGLELTDDYDERTRIFGWRNYIQTAAIFTGNWFYWFTLRPMFRDEISGVRWLSVIAGVVMIGCMIPIVRGIRERPPRQSALPKKDRTPVLKALKQTFHNRPFILAQSALLVVFLGIGVDGPIGQYLSIYYACRGDKNYASLIAGSCGALVTASIFLSPPLAMWISTRMGKREATIGGMLIMLLGVLLIPFTLSPLHPEWIVATWVLSAIGGQCCVLMVSSMMADICDEDERETGMRREGIYFASSSFLSKFCQVLMLSIGGWIPHLAGYTNFDVAPTSTMLERMKAIMIGTQLAGLLIALFLIWFYPITRARAEETRKILDARKRSQANEAS